MTRLITAVLAALTVFAFPTAAGPEILSAYSEFEGNAGVLLVGVRSTGGVSEMQADVMNGAGEVAASSSSFWRYREDGDGTV